MSTAEHSDESMISFVSPRLDEKPWGGQALRRFGLSFPADARIGEALVTANDAVITGGYGAGQTLGEIVAAEPGARLGDAGLAVVGGRPLFPLLVKLIDANENLSIQVHPDDEAARERGQPGKTEAWYVLDARPGSKLYLGLRESIDLPGFAEAAARLDGSSASFLRTVEPRPGETYLLPAGTIHALGAGVMVYEIQQPSDITYRLDDWGRVDSLGRPREMHREQGLAVAEPASRPEALVPEHIPYAHVDRFYLVGTRYFALERWIVGGEAILPASDAPQVLTVLAGMLETPGGPLGTGQSCVIWPAGRARTTVSAEDATVLRAWVP